MYSPLTVALKYLRYRITAANGKGHGIHSPFVFEFVSRVLNDRKKYAAYDRIEALRQMMLADRTPITAEDYGAGEAHASKTSPVSAIVSRAAKSPRYAQLLYRIANFYQPHYIIELGTSLGISAAYLASARPDSVVLTGEGNSLVASLARKNLHSVGLANVTVITGSFDDTLPAIIDAVPHIDLAFVDGNHREQPTLDYFRKLLQKMSPSSMIILDDIHWSRGMESAWEEVKNDPRVMLTIDLFFFGIAVFRPGFRVKQHFTIRF